MATRTNGLPRFPRPGAGLTPLFLALVALPLSAQDEKAPPDQSFALCFQLELVEAGSEVTADSCTEVIEIPRLGAPGTTVHLRLSGSYADRPLADGAGFERRFGALRAARRTVLPSGEVRELTDCHALSQRTVVFRRNESRTELVPTVVGRAGEPTAWLAELLSGDLAFRWLARAEGAPRPADAAALVGDLWPLRWGDLAAEPTVVATHGIAPIPRLDVGRELCVLVETLDGSVAVRPGPADVTRLRFELHGRRSGDDLVRALLTGTPHEEWLPFVSYWNEASLTLRGDGTARTTPHGLDSLRVRARVDLEQELGWEHWWDGPSQVQGRHREHWSGDMIWRFEHGAAANRCPHDADRG